MIIDINHLGATFVLDEYYKIMRLFVENDRYNNQTQYYISLSSSIL